MPPNPIQKSKLANKPAPNDKAVKQSWLRSKLRFLQPERYQKKSSTPQEKHIEAWQYKVATDFIPEPRKKPSQTENSYKPQRKHIEAWQNEVAADFIPEPRKKPSLMENSYTHQEKQIEAWQYKVAADFIPKPRKKSSRNGGYFESPQADLTSIRELPPIRLSQELRQSYSKTKDSQDPPAPLPALTFSKKQADYYNNLSPETRKTYGYPFPPKAFEIPRKPLQKHQYKLDENMKVGIGKSPNIVRPQTKNIPPPKPHLRAKSSSSQNSFRSGQPRAATTISFEAHMREFPEFDHYRPTKEYQKLQRSVEETKHARPQTVIASEVQRHKSVAGSICHEPSRRSSMPISEASHSRPGSSRIHAPVEQFQAQGKSLEKMLENEHHSLEAQDRRDAYEKHQRLLARSQRPRIPVTPSPSENISQSGTRSLRGVPITRSSHQPAAIPIPSSARPYRSRAPNIPRSSENNVRLETGSLERFPTSNQPSSSSRSHRHSTPLTAKPPTPLTPKSPQRTVHFQEKPSPGVPNTLKKRRPPPKSPQPLSDKVNPRPPLRPCLIRKGD